MTESETTPRKPKTPPEKLIYQRNMMRRIRAEKSLSVLQNIEIELAKKLGEKCDQDMKMDFDTVWPVILETLEEYRDAKTY